VTLGSNFKEARELVLVLVAAAIVTAALTYPMAFRISEVGRADTADGQYSLWNVAWVSHALLVDPLHVFDANIFYPHRDTLAYSESNLGAGVMGLGMYWATHNPYATLNFAALLSFALTAVGTYYLVRYVIEDRRAAAVSAICFAFCPHMFGHLAEIQALMALGIPFSMLAFHRLADRPTPGRGAVLGLLMTGEALCSGYYGVFVVFMIGYAVFVVAATRGLWRTGAYWLSIATGAAVAIAAVAPFYVPYARIRSLGFARTLNDAGRFVANWSAYFASSAYAHAWALPFLPPWGDVNFPGIVATVLGIGGFFAARTRREREVVLLYGGMTLLAFWMSFGPAAGLYAVAYKIVPMLSWLRTPSRFGLIVAFGLSMLAGLSIKRLLTATRHGTLAGVGLAAFTVAELMTPLGLSSAIPVAHVYRVLASLPRGPVIEMPFYYPEVGLYQHTKYMLASTAHWMPLVNGYSDYTPPDFYDNVMTLAPFPSREAMKILEPMGVRYAILHLYGYNTRNRYDAWERIAELSQYFRPIYSDDSTQLFEIVGYPK
jgi:hypothetical protein